MTKVASTVFEAWLRVSRLRAEDMLLVLSVGGRRCGKSSQCQFSCQPSNMRAPRARRVAAIVGRQEGYAAETADVCVVVPVVNPSHITPHSEAFQAVVWHALISHPALKMASTKWRERCGPS